MGRPEQPLDPSTGPLAEFAVDLRRLRGRAGNPAYSTLARRVHRSSSALSQAASGKVWPTLDTVLAYVQACGGDVVEWEARWRELDRSRARDLPADVPPSKVLPSSDNAPAGSQASDAAPDDEDAAPDDERGSASGGRRVLAWVAMVVSVLTVATLLAGGLWRSTARLAKPAASTGGPRPATTSKTPEETSEASAGALPASVAVRDGADPKDSGCASDTGVSSLDVQEVTAGGGPVGLLELRYSPACGVAWARFTLSDRPQTLPPGDVTALLTVSRPADGAKAPFRIPLTGPPVFGNVLNSTVNCVSAEVTLSGPGWTSPTARTGCYRGRVAVSAAATGP